jgi:hypothetical protein
MRAIEGRGDAHAPPSTVSVSALYLTYGVLGSVIFIRLSFWISVRARFSSSHCKLLGTVRLGMRAEESSGLTVRRSLEPAGCSSIYPWALGWKQSGAKGEAGGDPQ